MDRRLFVAGAVFLFGLVFVVWSYLHAQRPGLTDAPVVITEQVRGILNEDRFDTQVAAEQLEDLFADVYQRVLSEAQGIPEIRRAQQGSAADLATAFIERMRMLLSPEMSRDHQASAQRGDPMSLDQWVEANRKRVEYVGAHPPRLEFALDSVGVDVLFLTEKDEVNAPRDWLHDGFSRITSKRNANKFPLPDEPLEEGILSVEVRMLVYRADVITGQEYPAMVGYQFAWHPTRRQWIPYCGVVYRSPEHVFAAIPL